MTESVRDIVARMRAAGGGDEPTLTRLVQELSKSLSADALRSLQEAWVSDGEIAMDLYLAILGQETNDELFARCLKGADSNRVPAWREYANAVKAISEA